ncbi:MAG: glycosyl hydrolase family 18 protein [Bacillota bacterium]
MQKALILFVLLAMLVSSASGFAATAKPTATTPGIVAVFNEVYDGNSSTVNTQFTQNYKQIDFMYIAFVHVNSTGNYNYNSAEPIGTLDWENVTPPSTYTQGNGRAWEQYAYKNIYTLAHAQNPNMKFIVSLGYGSTLNDLPVIEANLGTFTNSLKAFIAKQKQLGTPIDGFDIDYESPTFSSKQKFITVATAIRKALTEQGTIDNKHYYFTITPNNNSNLDGSTLNNVFDYVNVQSYNTPPDATVMISTFTNMGVSASKILAGGDTQNNPTGYNTAINFYKQNNLAGVFSWIFGCIGTYHGYNNWTGTWSPDYSAVLTPMYTATHPAGSANHSVHTAH